MTSRFHAHGALPLVALFCLASRSNAQLIVGNGKVGAAETGWVSDVQSGATATLWSGHRSWALAADESQEILYSSSFDDLSLWTYSSKGAPFFIRKLTTAGFGSPFTPKGLAIANGALYASQNAKIYRIDVPTGVATEVWAPQPAIAGAFEGLSYNPLDGLFYATNNSPSAPSGPGLYSVDVLGVFGTGALSFITPYPAGVAAIDGLAMGDGRAYLVPEETEQPVRVYELAGGQYVASLTNPQTTFDFFNGAAWAPGVQARMTQTYCTAQTNSLGCVPSIGFAGTPSLTCPLVFEVTASDVMNQQTGLLFYGLLSTAVPFSGGTLCVAPPWRRTPVQFSGGSQFPADCTGSFSFGFNAWIQAGNEPNLTFGSRVYGQYWSRDPGAPAGTHLTNALVWTVGI